MSPEIRCPRCRTVIPPHASACVQCGMETPVVDDRRFNVVRKGQPFEATPNTPAEEVEAKAPAAALRAQEGDRVWYCRIGGQNIGPVTAADIRDAFSKGQIDGNASVGIRGHKDWFPIRSLPQFSDIVTGIGRPPTARPLPAPNPGGVALPGPQAPRRPPVPPGLPTPAAAKAPNRPGGPDGRHQPGKPPRPVQEIGKAPAASAANRDDDTQVVQPLPPPPADPKAGPRQSLQPDLTPSHHLALREEIAKLRRLVLALGVLSGVLLLSAATLLMLWLSA